MNVKSWKLGCKTRSDTTWAYNALRFATEAEAMAYGRDLHNRWTALDKYEAHGCDDAPSHKWEGGKLIPLG